MKHKLDPRYLKISLYVLVTAALLMIFRRFLDDSGDIFMMFQSVLGWVSGMLSPFIIGIIIAYLLFPIVNWFRKKIFRFKKMKESRRHLLSVSVAYALFLALLVWIIWSVIPGLTNSVVELAKNLPQYYESARQFAEGTMKELAINLGSDWQQRLSDAITTLGDSLQRMLGDAQMWGSAVAGITSFIGFIFSFFMGLLVAFYILLDRKMLTQTARNVAYSFFKRATAVRLRLFMRDVNRVISCFVSARLFESMILMALAYVVFLILGIPYAFLLAFIVGFTNLVPYIGPWIGGVIAAVITLFVSPLEALYVIIIAIALQAVDGWVLQPKLMGDSLGMRPFWVILGITVGGALFGIWGMLLGVPVMALLQLTLRRRLRRARRDKRDAMPPAA